MRTMYKWCSDTQKMIEIYNSEKRRNSPVVSDTIERVSEVDGSTVFTSRAKYREHLAANDCVEFSSRSELKKAAEIKKRDKFAKEQKDFDRQFQNQIEMTESPSYMKHIKQKIERLRIGYED